MNETKNRMRRLGARALLPLSAAAMLWGCGEPEFAASSAPGAPQALQLPAVAPGALRPRALQSKPARAVLGAGRRADVVVVKFHEGSRVRHGAGRLAVDAARSTDRDVALLRRAGVDRAAVDADVARLNARVAADKQLAMARLFGRPVEALDAEKDSGEAQSGDELADLNLYYSISIAGATRAQAEALIDELNALPSVEIAYAQPIPQDAAADIAPATPSYVSQQGHRAAAPAGIDAIYAATVPGAGGQGVKVIDVERGWNFDHEDLPSTFFRGGTPGAGEHGTAVLGVLAAAENRYGMVGIAPDVSIGVSTATGGSDGIAAAISAAAGQLGAGDIILIEQHYQGPDSGQTCTCNCSQFEYVAMEYFQADYDAIKAATANGIVVVEAAGNGSMNLDSAIYGNRFNRSTRDSGAILVGAGSAAARAPECWTNYGSRVDVQGWGDSVFTLGYGDLAKLNGSDVRQWYTNSFSGTSSASPIVTGAVAAIQGMRRSREQAVLTPTGVRSLLRTTGTAQAASPKQIGPLPNLKAALDSFGPPCSPDFHNLRSSQLQGCFDYWVARGRKPVTLTAYQIGGTTYMAGSFQPGASPPTRALMTAAQYQTYFDSYNTAGYRPNHISVMPTASGPRFTVIWAPHDGQFESYSAMTEAAFEAKWPVMKAQGFTLVDFTAYDDGGARYAATWVKKAFTDYIPQDELTSAQYNAAFPTMVAQGFYPLRFTAYSTAAGLRYAVLWQKPRPAFYHYYNLTGADYQAKYNELGAAGYKVFSLSGLGDRLSAIWVK